MIPLVVALTVARAAVELPLQPVGALGQAVQSPEELLATWALVLRSEEIRRAAGAEVGSAIEATDVRAHADGGRIRLEVDGEGRQGAVARCLALLRAAERKLHLIDEAPLEFMRTERAQLAQKLVLLERKLTQPPAPGASTDDPRLALLEARRALQQLDDADLMNARELPWKLQAIAEEAVKLIAERAELSARYAERHPQVVEVTARLDAVRQRFARQREVERTSLKALVAQLEKIPARPPALAVRRARAAAQNAVLSVQAPGDCTLASDAPPELQPLSETCASAQAELDRLSLRYAERHPQVIAAQARLDEARRRFTHALAQPRAPLAIDEPERAHDQRQVEQLRLMLVGLGDRIAHEEDTQAHRAPRLKVVDACSAN